LREIGLGAAARAVFSSQLFNLG